MEFNKFHILVLDAKQLNVTAKRVLQAKKSCTVTSHHHRQN